MRETEAHNVRVRSPARAPLSEDHGRAPTTREDSAAGSRAQNVVATTGNIGCAAAAGRSNVRS